MGSVLRSKEEGLWSGVGPTHRVIRPRVGSLAVRLIEYLRVKKIKPKIKKEERKREKKQSPIFEEDALSFLHPFSLDTLTPSPILSLLSPSSIKALRLRCPHGLLFLVDFHHYFPSLSPPPRSEKPRLVSAFKVLSPTIFRNFPDLILIVYSSLHIAFAY